MAAEGHPLDAVLIPIKGFLFRQVFRGDERRYLGFRNSVAHAAARARLYEPESLKAVSRFVREGDVALDVGASFGVYTAELARRVGRTGEVHAFEPQPAVYEMLIARFRGNPSVRVVNSALGDEPGSAHFVVPKISSDIPETALGSLSRGADGRAVVGSTKVTTIDEYCADFERLAFIKIDAEGWDLDVLRGARETLARLRPVVQVETNDATTLSAVQAFADDVGYAVGDRILSGVNRILQPL